jgi:glycosyltransferase involved in cell wall biosynthesis
MSTNNSTNKPLKILITSPRIPYPMIGGDRIKLFHVIEHLAKEHEVTLVTLHQSDSIPNEYINAIENTGCRLYTIPFNGVSAGLRAGTKYLFKYPLEIGFYTQPAMKRIVDDLCEIEHFDLAISFFMRGVEYIKNLKIKKILIAEDCRTLYQYRSFKQSKNPVQKLVRMWDYNMLKKYEPETVNYFDIITLVTAIDIEQMKLENPDRQYRILTNGTDIEKFHPSDNGSAKNGILFTGKLDLWANIMMINYINEKMLPRIKEKYPDIIFNVVGAKPKQNIKTLANEHVKIFADVPSVTPFLQNTRLYLHPHTGSTGIQNKILEAMACGCPIVTTPTGIQGIPVTHGREVMIGTNEDELLEHSLTLLDNPTLAENLGKNARKLIEEKFTWDIVLSQLDNILGELF